ncbi:hypothetical protein Peur_008712 [Populus x canadensis]
MIVRCDYSSFKKDSEQCWNFWLSLLCHRWRPLCILRKRGGRRHRPARANRSSPFALFAAARFHSSWSVLCMSSALHPSNSSGGGKGRDRLSLDDLAAILCPILCPPVKIVDVAV